MWANTGQEGPPQKLWANTFGVHIFCPFSTIRSQLCISDWDISCNIFYIIWAPWFICTYPVYCCWTSGSETVIKYKLLLQFSLMLMNIMVGFLRGRGLSSSSSVFSCCLRSLTLTEQRYRENPLHRGTCDLHQVLTKESDGISFRLKRTVFFFFRDDL